MKRIKPVFVIRNWSKYREKRISTKRSSVIYEAKKQMRLCLLPYEERSSNIRFVMDKIRFDTVEKELREEIRLQKAELDAELERRLDALRVAFGMAPAIKVQLIVPLTSNQSKSEPWPGMRIAAIQSLQKITGEFTKNDIEPIIKSRFPLRKISPGETSNALWMLAKEGRIKVTKPGLGKEPHVYEKSNAVDLISKK